MCGEAVECVARQLSVWRGSSVCCEAVQQGSKLGKIARSQLAPRYFFLGANIDN